MKEILEDSRELKEDGIEGFKEKDEEEEEEAKREEALRVSILGVWDI